jgi:hypothetical protein
MSKDEYPEIRDGKGSWDEKAKNHFIAKARNSM